MNKNTITQLLDGTLPLSGFDSLLAALRFTNAALHEQLSGFCITLGPDQRYYVSRFVSFTHLSSLGHEVISLH